MKPELFFLPHSAGEILYAPLKNFIAVVNHDAKDAVSRRLSDLPLQETQQGVIDILEKHGIFAEDCQYPPVDEEFAPTRVTLFPTDRCNLRCRYCYASAGEGGHRLSLPAARAAIDFIAANAKIKKQNLFSVGFHGNGEPFTALEVVREVCDYISSVAERDNLKYVISTATNGVMSEDCLDYLVAWISDVNVSSDILPDIQNQQRPRADGSGTFDSVDHTLKRLDQAGVQYGIRATITGSSVSRLREMAAFVKENYPRCQLLHLEPMFEVGRALDTKQSTPHPEIFVREFLKAQQEMQGTGTRLVYSGERANTICQCFCGVCSNGFTVTAEGNVTSCYEICTYRDSRAKRYIYGKYDEKTGGFVFDRETMAGLLELQVKNISFCADCFCKWHCGGDCMAKSLGIKPLAEHAGSERCVINRALIYRQLLQRTGVDVSNLEPVFI
ncbi:MAG: 4Fe-4S cluster-binding domain-containing protein [Firmicutes bacterium]|nr:4Fe-4S cluster-binding domain-containing protein [Bacillota bacterium]